MSYIDGFVIPVPAANKEQFIEHARTADQVFMEQGALRVIETWSDDVAAGTHTDFFKAVAAEEGDSVVFSWIEWPDKATRDNAMVQMEALIQTDPRMNTELNPMPFDGRRLIYGGFEPVVTLEANS